MTILSSYAEMYAKRHNISFADTIEKGVLLLLDNFQINQDVTKTAEFQDALTYVKTLKATGGRPIPVDENGLASSCCCV